MTRAEQEIPVMVLGLRGAKVPMSAIAFMVYAQALSKKRGGSQIDFIFPLFPVIHLFSMIYECLGSGWVVGSLSADIELGIFFRPESFRQATGERKTRFHFTAGINWSILIRKNRSLGLVKEGSKKMSSLKSVTDATFEAEVIRNKGTVLVDFWAPWCGPCRMLGPTLEQIQADNPGKLNIVKLDIDQNPKSAVQFKVQSIPMMILFKDGKMVDSKLGNIPRSQIESWLGL